MAKSQSYVLSVVVPVYNEGAGIAGFHASLLGSIERADINNFEIIYVNDGSTDDSWAKLKVLAKDHSRVRVLSLSRNFGKEIATTAGLHAAVGHAIITIDADGQHPPELIPEFIERWQAGAKVVIGVRQSNQHEGLIKRFGSKVFYKTYNRLTGIKMIPGSSDYRLIDRSVQQEFVRMTERSRITRGLIDWLGYRREYIKFKANPRLGSAASYSFKKLLKLFVDSMVSMSKSPLYISAYLGAVILPLSTLIGLVMVVDAVLGDPLNLNASGSAYIVVLLLFLVGVLLVSQGIIGLYLSHIHTETQNRPIYIVDKERSINISED
jgi:dolichol-phosphate mannosyltransferase